MTELTQENSKMKKNARVAQGNEKCENISLKDFMEEFRDQFDSQDKKFDKNHPKMEMMNLKLGRLEEH